jgi:tetrahydrodipicolinate N-succinyltransferase
MPDDTKPSGWQKLLVLLEEETRGIHPRLHLMNLAGALLPRRPGGAARARLLALTGFQVGAGTIVTGTPRLNGDQNLYGNLVIGEDCAIDADCSFDLEEKITIGNSVTIGPGVMILTSTHELDKREHRAGPVQRSPVNIGAGAWLGARSIILPGVTIGAGAIVNPGAVVNKDVAPHTRVGGMPAVQLEVLKPDEPAAS